VAYQSDESGKSEVYVAPLSGTGSKSEISTQGGRSPLWSRNGRELFYEDYANQLVAVDIPAGPVFRPGRQQALFQLDSRGEYAVTPDPNRFLVEHVPQLTSTFVTVNNWFDDVLRRAALKH
jgi:hypothetical protein